MISVRIGSHRFQYRVGAVIIDDDQLLLHRLAGDAFWAVPGGRVNAGEQAGEAVVRELREELGVAIECGRLLCTGENFFDHGGQAHHEVGLYFEATLPAGSPILDKQVPHRGQEEGRILEFKWFPLTALAGIDLRPAALGRVLGARPLPPHFVQHG
ncbi:NUDIX hydrolase [Aquabacterium humicola]|uniref:NUDIX hydrolase n=1 Tax=Aquabacterium humicola TaxID=3237377 RepID=UPI002542AAA8|nr:NUDIX hydrolase [Rubrivivax pictus]